MREKKLELLNYAFDKFMKIAAVCDTKLDDISEVELKKLGLWTFKKKLSSIGDEADRWNEKARHAMQKPEFR